MSNYLRRTDTFQTIKARQYILPNPTSTQNYTLGVVGPALSLTPLGSTMGLQMNASGGVLFTAGLTSVGSIGLQTSGGVPSLQVVDGGITSTPTIGSSTAYNPNRFAILSAGATSFNGYGGNYVAGNGIRLQGADIEWSGGSIVSKGSVIEIDGGRSATAAVNHGQIRMYSGGDLALTLTETGGAIIEGDLEVKGAVTFDVSLNAIPAGVVTMFAFGSPPPGWLNCDGTSYSTTTYARLFAVIGYGYGGSGASFNVPDMRGRFPLGSNATYGLNSQGGSMTTALSAANLPSHTHGFTGSTGTSATNITATDSGHTHPYGDSTAGGGGLAALDGENGNRSSWDNPRTTSSGAANITIHDPSHSHTFAGTTDGGTGAGSAFQTAPPYIGMNFIIKT
jgi:microcystin-dependent protein